MKKRPVLYELIISKKGSASIIDKSSKRKTDFKFTLQRAWKLKMYLEENNLVELPWDCMDFKENTKLLNDYNFISESYNENKMVIEIIKREKPLTIKERVNILRHEHTTGRWGQNIADAELNNTRDYVILNTYDHDIDYMFSESVNSKYWIYNVKTMKEIEVGKDLNYRYLHNSLGIRESGVDDVCFSKDNPYHVLVKYSDDFGENKETEIIELPHD